MPCYVAIAPVIPVLIIDKLSEAKLAQEAAGSLALVSCVNEKPCLLQAKVAKALNIPLLGPMTGDMALRDKAFRAANYYLRKTGGTRAGQPFLAPQVRAQALECQQWLRRTLQTPFAGPTVVVTHFAPSLRSADPRYGLVPGTAGFCNGLDDLLALAQLWLHGHLHAPVDYTVQGCRVLANPLGYARKGEQRAFVPQMCIATGAAPLPYAHPDLFCPGAVA